MEIPKYVIKKKEFYESFLNFIEETNNSNDVYEKIIKFLDNQNIKGNPEELKSFLHLLIRIFNNHYRTPAILNKTKHILQNFRESIRHSFSNSEIYYLFSKNKLLLLFLIENQTLEFDQSIAYTLIQKYDTPSIELRQFFYNEIKPFVDEKASKSIENKLLSTDRNIFTNFNEKRQKGENDNFLCQLIQNDSIDDFVNYVTKNKISLTSTIKHSIFETNRFLVKNKSRTTLIEYSAFFGSIQIFNYLQKNKVELTPSLWLYAIHSNSKEFIHILEENHVKPSDETFEKCFREAVKCHHNEIARFIKEKYIKNNVEERNSYGFHFYNHSFIQDDFKDNNNVFYYACQYDYIQIVKFFLTKENLDLNAKIIILNY